MSSSADIKEADFAFPRSPELKAIQSLRNTLKWIAEDAHLHAAMNPDNQTVLLARTGLFVRRSLVSVQGRF